ncbi:phenylacetic acid degradation protein [Renibacterium salmoninarum ATCC 33209]|uniref:Phenylacetic acid degradation protein n=1 Tax=Renibacterium salmoninarum (strain ATCC 33209 / DSM 20767 / JCM 11484 / NBRC 15589 / NCIMB 2235) TaxID=288705 RepID=A9WRV3_RENSM|nr:1,2-phenylacetyl-CoA epoxidase subunit PaaC [Renibacterium salmoninarum]ABY24385.1 phenylacetic acid degradation protein [Renibacterium salmoninarum ATCC 33209]
MAQESATRITPGNALRPEDIADAGARPSATVAEYALRLGDDGLILAQRLGWWISRAPELEEDVALGNIALDELGHARSFLSYAAGAFDRPDGTPQTEDDLAYWRGETEFRCAQLFEQPNGDFARTIARQLVVSVYQFELYSRLQNSSDSTLAAIAAKAVKEVDYHRDHASQWVLRLAFGTEESRRRMIHGLALTWPYVEELFDEDALYQELGSIADGGVSVPPSLFRAEFDAFIAAVLTEAELEIPQTSRVSGGGRRGQRSEHLGYLLAEMQVLAREHPGAGW